MPESTPPLLLKVLERTGDIVESLRREWRVEHGAGFERTVTCPAHDDNRPSLSMGWSPEKRKVLLHCQAGCSISDVIEALGLTYGDLQESQAKRKHVCNYDYVDAAGALVFQVQRWDPKAFSQRRRNPAYRPGRGDGEKRWINSVKDEPRAKGLPYRLPQLLRALADGDDICITEGEKDADAIMLAVGEDAGVAATCNAGGAGSWLPEHSEWFRGSISAVTVIADRDESGKGFRHAVRVADDLERVMGRRPRIVGSAVGKDAADHVENHSLEELQPIPQEDLAEACAAVVDDSQAATSRDQQVAMRVEALAVEREARALLAAENWEPPPSSGSWAEQLGRPPEPMRWLIDQLAFEGANVLISAQAKSGKTSLALNVVHSLLSGDPLFGHFPVTALPEGRTVAWWNAELSHSQADTWLRNFNPPRPADFHPQHMRGYEMPFEVQRVEDWAVEWLRSRHVSAWVIDPKSALFGGDENSNSEVGAWLKSLDRIKRRAGVDTVFLVHHVSESSDDAEPGRMLKPRGASRLVGWADVLWSYSGRFEEPRYLAAVGRDVDLPTFGGLVMHPGSRLLRLNGAPRSRAEDKRARLAHMAWEIVRERGEPMKAGELQGAMPGSKADPKRRALDEAVAQGWLTCEQGPRNSTLYSLGEASPVRRTLSVEGGETPSADQ